MLGVLDTVPDPRAVLAEVRRVLTPVGRLGLLAYVARDPLSPDEVPTGNRFQTVDELLRDLSATKFAVIDRIDASTLPPAPVDWKVRQDRLESRIADAHGDDPRHREASEQADRFAALLESGRVGATLLHLVCV
jgi:hypothetical protein